MINKNSKKIKYIIILFFVIYFLRKGALKIVSKGKRVGIIGFMPDRNIGNNLLKYSMYIFLKKNGFYPTLISFNSSTNTSLYIFFKKKYKYKTNKKLLY